MTRNDAKPMTPRAILVVVALVSLASACKTNRGYVTWLEARPDIDGAGDVRLVGPTFGWEGGAEGGPAKFVELQLIEDEDAGVDFDEVDFGYRSAPMVRGPFELRGQYDIGITSADVAGFQNSNTLVSLGLGLQPRIRLGQHVSLVGLVGFRFYFDWTRETTCNDGTRTNSLGVGVCADHGGIRHYNDHIGDSAGFEAALGLSFSF